MNTRANAEGAKPAAKKEDKTPYPGLTYYKPSQADLFAGRGPDIKKCADAIFRSRVLLLHGPTGCGKSSFLRAGVKPRIEKLAKDHKFPGGADQFEVIRSTAKPLFEFAKRLRALITSIDPKTRKSERCGAVKRGADLAALFALVTDERMKQMARNPSAVYKTYVAFLDAFEATPILVIDQGEEVFTLNDDAQGGAAEIDEKRAGHTAVASAAETAAYFAFLRMVVTEGGGPLIVSLRTEYKGRLDDKIAGESGHPGSWLKGYYLQPLDEDALVEAIIRPTLSEEDWAKRDVKSKAPPWKALKFRLNFPRKEAVYLAQQLLDVKAVPPGGVLPALQIACRRLYAQAVAAADGKVDEIKVRRSSIKRLGAVADQVLEYVNEEIEAACKGQAVEYNTDLLTFSELVDLVHRALATVLVRDEPDGRAVTRHFTRDDLNSALAPFFNGRLLTPWVVLEALVSPSVLRDHNTDEPEDTEERWSLGHDSIALALLKWRLKHVREDQSMMRMMMGARGQPSGWSAGELYPAGEEPPKVTVRLPRDFLWDRQLPHFAKEKRFDVRLGIHFEDAAGLDATDTTKGPRTWGGLVKTVSEMYGEGAKPPPEDPMIVAAEWGAFPLIIRDEVTDKYDEDANARLPPRHYAFRWTDLAATNMNLGNGLIGPELKDVAAIGALEGEEVEQVKALRAGIKAILDYLMNKRAQIRVFDLRAQRLLSFAADLVYPNQKDRLAFKAYLKEEAASQPNTDYKVRDPIIEYLMRNEDIRADARVADEGDAVPHFAVAGAFPRAMAVQSGLLVYFNAKHISMLARYEMDCRAARSENPTLPKSDYAGHVPDLAAGTQRITSHTLWQYSLENAQWDFGANRATVLRLASLAYYTTEYARTSMDELVTFLQKFTNKFLNRDVAGDNSMKGVRLSHSQIRNAVRDCYTFVRFEDYGTQVFDLDAPFAYWSDHSYFASKSVAPSIYQELLSLRQKTLDHFDSCTGAISWLRYRESYFPDRDEEVSRAFKDKEYAWRHFRILNFYDAERFMARAAATLATRLDNAEKLEDKVAQWRKDRDRAEAKSQKE